MIYDVSELLWERESCMLEENTRKIRRQHFVNNMLLTKKDNNFYLNLWKSVQKYCFISKFHWESPSQLGSCTKSCDHLKQQENIFVFIIYLLFKLLRNFYKNILRPDLWVESGRLGQKRKALLVKHINE